MVTFWALPALPPAAAGPACGMAGAALDRDRRRPGRCRSGHPRRRHRAGGGMAARLAPQPSARRHPPTHFGFSAYPYMSDIDRDHDGMAAPGAVAGHTGGVMGVVRVSLVAAVLAGVLAAGGCSPAPRCPAGASCPATVPFKVTFSVTVNGRVPSPSRILPRFSVRPAQLLAISVVVTVPGRARVSALWLGISTGTVGVGPNGPTGVDPVLVHSGQMLTAGRHSFTLRWRTPAKARPGSRLYLAAAWASRQRPVFSEGQLIAHLVLD